MKILFDHGTPAPLRGHLIGHEVATAYEMGWARFSNGDLLREPEAAFDLLITTDQNLKYQQNLGQRRVALLVLSTTSWPRIQKYVAQVITAVSGITSGDFLELEIPQ
jgi:hypothetical protein